MEELLGHLLAFIFQFVFEGFGELILELFGEAIADVLSRGTSRLAESLGIVPNRIVKLVGFCALGAGAGALSLFLYPHPLFHPSNIHGISLLISPLVAGLIMSGFGIFCG